MSSEDFNISTLAFKYGEALSKSKKFNPQTVSISRLIENKGQSFICKELQKDAKDFCEDNSFYTSRDFVYKSDYFTPRNMHLISPIYYLYYIKLVFEVFYSYSTEKEILDFSSERILSFYSGRLEFVLDEEKIMKNSKFNKSYKSFQKEREEFFGHPALKIDLKDFFPSIKMVNLKEKLESYFGKNSSIDNLFYFYSFCGFTSLPQFHYSIASSILAQFYLKDFDDKIKPILNEEGLILIRFVDDMFIIPEDKQENKKRNNELLHLINHFLWEDELVLNSNKTKMLSPEEYKVESETVSGTEESIKYTSEMRIKEKAEEIVGNDDLYNLLLKLHALEKNEGVNFESYKKLTDEYIAINGEDTFKIINNLVFTDKWETISDEQLMEIIRSWRFVLFNPSQFTILYVKICRYLENRRKVDGRPIRKLLNYLLKRDDFTFRDTLVASAYLFQNDKKHKDLLKKISTINRKYVKFIELYIS